MSMIFLSICFQEYCSLDFVGWSSHQPFFFFCFLCLDALKQAAVAAVSASTADSVAAGTPSSGQSGFKQALYSAYTGKTLRTIYASCLWHLNAINDAMLLATFLKFNESYSKPAIGSKNQTIF